MSAYDYIIVGSGIAGLYTALLARQHGSVLVLTKSSTEETSTKHAQGGIAAAIGDADSAELHFQDTIAAGAGLCDAEAVRILVDEAPDRIADLVYFGVTFDTQEGRVALTQEAAHSLPRILHAGGDATGEHIEVTLSRMARQARVTILEHCLVSDILVNNGAASGVRALDLASGSTVEFEARWVILATGGGGHLFKFTTNPAVATGDGVALAYAAGAEVTDIEFFQFHPTALRLPGVPPFLISEAVRGEGGVLRDVNGLRFMPEMCAQGDLAPRDVVSRCIVSQMKSTGSDRVFLDVTHLPARKVMARFPNIYRFCLDHGVDIATTPIPVAPAAHYMMGGVKTNVWGETNIWNLFASGETACTGVHGANRLASNSLLEVVVFAKRIIQRTVEGRPPQPAPQPEGHDLHFSLPVRRVGVDLPRLSLSALQSLMWNNVGLVRSQQTLERAAGVLAGWEHSLGRTHDRPSYELANMVLVGKLMAEAALIREESRGAHFRSDFPEPVEKWRRRIILSRSQNNALQQPAPPL